MTSWYAMSDLPPVACRVRAWWFVHGVPHLVDVARLRQHKAWHWYQYADGKVLPLPPRGREKTFWAAEPECWQPLDAETWVWPSGQIPRPLPPHVAPRLVADRMRFQSVEDAEAADLAREMERDRADAKSGPGVSSQRGVDADPRWWWIGSNVVYEPKGAVSLRQAEGRLMRAVACCGSRAGLTLNTRSAGGVLADMADAAAEAARIADKARFQELDLLRFRALPQDHDDFLVAMAWFAALDPPLTWRRRRTTWSLNKAQQCLVLRTLPVPLSFAEIGDILKWKGHQRAQQVYRASIHTAWQIANGCVVPRDYVSEMRESLRANERSAAG